MSGEREAALRRIAIVLSSLPPAVATRLLGELDANSKQLVRRTMTGLSDVDPLERKRAIQAFAGSVRQQQSSPTKSQDEILLTSVTRPATANSVASRVRHQFSAVDHANDNSASASAGGSSSNIPKSLALLADIEDDALVRSVSGEHPQTVALLLASIAPAQAARILPRLESRLRSEAMSRIGRLGEIPSEMVEELAQHILSRIEPKSTVTPQAVNSDGRRRLDAILASMPQTTATSPPSARPRVLANDAVASSDLVHAANVSSLPSPVNELQPLRIAPQTQVESQWNDEGPDEYESATPASSQSHGAGAGRVPLLWSTDDIHNHLLRLSAVELRDALAAVDTHDALMALCGLPVETTDAVIATLPKPAGREIRLQLASIGSMQLREIDIAKERVAIASLPEQARTQALSSVGLVRVPMAA